MTSPDPTAPQNGMIPALDDKSPNIVRQSKLGRLTQRVAPALWACIAVLFLFIFALVRDWPIYISGFLGLFLIIFLGAHFVPKHATEILKWLRENLKLAAVSAVASIAGFLVLNYTNGLKQEMDLIRASADAERSQSNEAIRNRDEKIQNLLSAIVNVPVLLSPQNARSRASVPRVVLQWASQVAHEHYLVEMTRFDGSGKSVSKTIPATNPQLMSSTYPYGYVNPVEPGAYFWRVAAGDLEEGRPAPQSSWSGYYRFDIFTSAIERIHQNHRLTVGVTYNQNSDFMRRNEDGTAYGFDAELMKIMSDELSKDSQLNVDSSKWQEPDVVEYPTIDALLRTGIKGGEVDFALSSVTKTRSREYLGIKFTQGYFESHLVVLGRAGVGSKTIKNAEVGFIEKTTNAFAVEELCRRHQCTPVPFKSFQDTVNALTDGTVQFILEDEPLSLQLIQQKQVRVVMHDVGPELPDYRSQIGYPKEEYAIATPDEDLQKRLKKILGGLDSDGTLVRLRRKYHLAEDQRSR